MDHTYKNEKTLFVIAVVIGSIFWAAILILTLGLALIYVPFVFLGYLFAHSAFISHLRGNAVRLSEAQFPDLHAQFMDCCRKLEMEAPEAYVMMSNGVLNALATKFLRRKYVVLNSAVLDALKSRPDAVRFYFGHELAHIKRGHLNLGWLKFPALVLPLLGAAYRRAQEYTCDMHGLAVSASLEEAQLALGVLGSGGEKLPALNVNEFMGQRAASGGFWMSFHELTNDYPWLCKRLARVSEHHGEAIEPNPERNIGAWILAVFVPRMGIPGGGAMGGLMIVAIIGILAAIAIPAYQDYMVRSQVMVSLQNLEAVQHLAAPFVAEHQAYPKSLAQIGAPESAVNSRYGTVSLTDEGIEFTFHGGLSVIENQTIVYGAYKKDNGEIGWSCAGGTLPAKYRPVKCR
jgi:Tfp pilus assembly major pilin PilA/Zn-dependent protease with chaperone function